MKNRAKPFATETEEAAAGAEVLEIEEESRRLLETTQKTEDALSAVYRKMVDGGCSGEEIQGKVGSLKRTANNLFKAWTQIHSASDELNARWSDLQNQKKKRRFIAAPPANAAIDLGETRSDHFARGLNLYKLLLICFTGSFVGVVIELLWCLITNGYLESRSGLVYGPFNLLYGAGAAALTACLYRFRNRGSWLSFLGGMAVGSAVEYVCSWAQELLFGSRSWDYSHLPFNINGRICLLYSVFWGILGVLWIKNLYPRTAQLILKIPNRIGKPAVWALTVFFILNALLSCACIYRWSQRDEGIAPSNAFWELIDERFPDERMEKIYANMEFVEE